MKIFRTLAITLSILSVYGGYSMATPELKTNQLALSHSSDKSVNPTTSKKNNENCIFKCMGSCCL